MRSAQTMIHFFCALPCEANPLIQHFKLTELKQFDLFPLYQSKDKQFTLTITGIGKLNAASAVSYLHACFNTKISDIWLNIGVAGHENLDIGEVRLINKITDEQDNTSWYPQIIFDAPCQQASLITLDKPSTEYQKTLFDMEASGFYQMATRLGTAELIHCLKIISDNTQQPTHTVNAESVKKLIAAQTETIETIVELLVSQATEMVFINTIPPNYATLIERWHFTQTEQIQLLRLLRQWTVRFPDKDIVESVTKQKTGKTILNTLQNYLNETPFSIY